MFLATYNIDTSAVLMQHAYGFFSAVPRVIASLDHDASTTSVVLNITYIRTIIIENFPDFTVRVILIPGNFTALEDHFLPKQSIHLRHLQPGTFYEGTFQVIDRSVIVDSITITFTTDSGKSLGTRDKLRHSMYTDKIKAMFCVYLTQVGYRAATS